MKKSGLFAASVAAASASAITASSSSSSSSNFNCKSQFSRQESGARRDGEDRASRENGTASPPSLNDKFAPRFDGLRFIETLVTAHR